MHWFDVVFGVITCILVILGIKRGFIDEVMRLASIVIGFIFALLFYRQFIPRLAFLSLSPQVAVICSFIVIFIGVALAVIVIGKLIKKVIRLTMLGWLDMLCGACIGAIKAFFLGWIFIISVSALPMTSLPRSFKGSSVYSFFTAISPTLKSEVLKRVYGPATDAAKNKWLVDAWKNLTSQTPKADSLPVKKTAKKATRHE
jgi:membrane protein required for colicin V production